MTDLYVILSSACLKNDAFRVVNAGNFVEAGK